MCVPVHSEKAAAAIIADYLRQIEHCKSDYPDSPSIRSFIANRLQRAQHDLRWFQDYDGWLLNYDVETLQPKPAPKVVKDPGLAKVKRALQPARLRKLTPDTSTGVEAIERQLTVGSLKFRRLADMFGVD